MNHCNKSLQLSLDELDEWLFQRSNIDSTSIRPYESIKNLLENAVNSEPQEVDGIVKTILHILADSVPDEKIQAGVMQSEQHS